MNSDATVLEARSEATLRPAPTWRGVLTLFALAFVAFAPAMFAGFIWDDPDHVLNNQTLRSLHGLATMWSDRTSLPQWYPLTHTTFWIEYQLWGASATGYHVDNILLHALSGVLLWRLLAKCNVPGAFLAAAIFTVHPVMVETVAWVTERKNTLSLAFYLLASHAYLPIALHHETSTRDGGFSRHQNVIAKPRYFLALALFIFALLSKSVTSTFPAAMLLVIAWKKNCVTKKDILRLAPFFVLSIIASVNTGYLERTHVIGKLQAIPELQFTLVQRVMIAGRAIWFYASKLAWPHNLAFIYPRWNSIDARQPWNLLFALATFGLLAALFALRRRIGRGPSIAVLFFSGTLVPALGFVSVYPMRFSFVADHFQYHASIGLIALAAASAARRLPAPAFKPIATIVVTVFAILTFRRCLDFHDATTLWTDTRAKNDHSWLVDTNLANALHADGDDEHAADLYLDALRLNPNWFETHLNAAGVFRMRGDLDRAISELRKALELNPEFTDIHTRIATIQQQRGDLDAAEKELRTTIAGNPQNLETRTNYGLLLMSMKRYDDAILQLRNVTTAIPNEPGAWFNLAAAQLAAGRRDDAIDSLRKAIAIDPTSPKAQAAAALIRSAK